MRTAVEPPVHWLLHYVLEARKGTCLSNYGKVFEVFFIAYVLHGMAQIWAGSSRVGDWNYFMGQAVATWAE